MSLKLINFMTRNTDDYPDVDPTYNSWIEVKKITKGQLYYAGTLIKYNNQATDEAIQSQERGPVLSLTSPSTEFRILSNIGEKKKEEQFVSMVFRADVTADDVEMRHNSFPNNPNALTTYRHVFFIDITSLERDFPYFASLSDSEKKTLLDETLPYISAGETFEFNGVLRNWIYPTSNKTDWSDGISNKYDFAVFTYRYGSIIENKSFLYGRFDFYYTTDNTTENYMWCTLYADGGAQAYASIDSPLPNKIYTASATYHVTPIYDGLRTIIFAGDSNLVQGKTCYWRGVLVMDLYQDGAYLFFRLLGMSDDDIKSYLDTLPFFADTYSIGPAYLDKAGLEYYHSKILQMISSLSTSTSVQTVSEISEAFSLKDVRSIAYGLNRFVAAGLGGKGAYSTDGVTWHLFEDMKLEGCQTASVSYGDGTFIAIGSNGKVSRSTDGVTWSSIENTTIQN